MNNQQAIVDQIIQNLAFEVEAVPKNKSIRTTNISQSTPLNVKIKVRKKDEIHTHHDPLSNDDDTLKTIQKIRLVNSYQTIMTFDVFMEAAFENKPQKKLHKHIFDKLRPGICLGATDDDEYPYMPSSSYSANITEPSNTTRSADGTLKQTFTLAKNYAVSTQPREQKWLFGKCKPGGCLDPPFSEDKYSYKPSTRSGSDGGEVEIHEDKDVKCGVHNNRSSIELRDEDPQSYGRHSSIFNTGFFKKKRKSSDKSTSTKLPDKADSIVDLYQVGSVTNFVSTHSNSIITYPPKIKSDPKIAEDKKSIKSREPSEGKSRKSFNDHSEPFFTRPKEVNYIKEKDKLNSNKYPNHQSSNTTNSKNSREESYKMPVSIPIPIAVPISIKYNKQRPEKPSTNNDILKMQDDNTNVFKLDSELDQELHEELDIKDTDIRPQYLRAKMSTGNIDNQPIKSLNMTTSVPSMVEEPVKIDGQDLVEPKLQPVHEKNSTNNVKDTAQLHKKSITQSLKMTLTVPITFSEPNLAAAAVDSKTINKNLQKTVKELTPSKQSFEIKTAIEVKNHFEDCKDKQNIGIINRSEENESTTITILNSNYSDIESDTILQNCHGTGVNILEQISGTENPKAESSITAMYIEHVPSRKEITERNEKPTTQNNVKDNDTLTIKCTEYLHPRRSLLDQIGATENDLSESLVIKENTKQDANENENVEKIEKPTTQTNVKNNDVTTTQSTQHIRVGGILSDHMSDIEHSVTKIPIMTENIIRDTKGKVIIERIEKPATQQDVKNKNTTATKSTEHLRIIGSLSDQTINIENPVTETPITIENIKHISKRKEIIERNEKSATQNYVKDNDTTATKYVEYLHTRRSWSDQICTTEKVLSESPVIMENTNQDEKENIERIEKPTTQTNVKKNDPTTTQSIEHIRVGGIFMSDIEHSVTKIPITDNRQKQTENIIQDAKGKVIIERIEKPATQNDVKDKNTTATKSTERLRIIGSLSDQTINIKNLATEAPITTDYIKHTSKIKEIIERNEKPATQNYVKGNDTPAPRYTEFIHTRRSTSDQISAAENVLSETPVITENTKRDAKKKENIKRIEKPTTQTNVKSNDPTTTKSTEHVRVGGILSDHLCDIKNSVTEIPTITKNIIPDSKGKVIIERIEKPTTQKDVKDKDKTATKSIEQLRIGGSFSRISNFENPVIEVPTTTENITQDFNGKEITEYIEKPISQNDVQYKDISSTKYIKETSDVYVEPKMDTHQIIESRKSDTRKVSHRISMSKLHNLQKKFSVNDKPMKKHIADKKLYKEGYRGSDLSDHKDKNHISLSSGSDYETDPMNSKTAQLHSDTKEVSKTIETSNNRQIDSYIESQTRFINERNMNFVAASAIIDESEQTPNFNSRVEDVNSDTKITNHDFDLNGIPLSSQMASRVGQFDLDGETYSSISHELVGTRSFVYDAQGSIQSTSPKKNAERITPPDKRVFQTVDTFLSSIQSTISLKSDMKKDTISVELGFHSYLNNKNERVLRTFDAAHVPKRSPSGSITILKSQVRISYNEIRIPVDSEHDISLQIKKANAKQRVSISESGFVNMIDNGKIKQRSLVQSSDAKSSPVAKTNNNILESGAAENETNSNLTDYYEQELVPLQLIIRSLRDEIDDLAKQQLMFKNKMFCSNKSKLPRLVHSNKKCFGCIRK